MEEIMCVDMIVDGVKDFIDKIVAIQSATEESLSIYILNEDGIGYSYRKFTEFDSYHIYLKNKDGSRTSYREVTRMGGE